MSANTISTILTPSTGCAVKGGINKDTTQEISGRFYLNAKWTPSTIGWQYLTSPTLAVAFDAQPSINAAVSTSTNPSVISFNNSTGLFYIPKTGRWNFNILTQAVNNTSAANGIGYEWRLCVFSAPAWPAVGTSAQTYGSTAGSAGALVGTPAATLASTTFIMTNESGFSYTGNFPAGTYIAPVCYIGSTSTVQSGSSPLAFNVGSIYLEAKLDYTLQP